MNYRRLMVPLLLTAVLSAGAFAAEPTVVPPSGPGSLAPGERAPRDCTTLAGKERTACDAKARAEKRARQRGSTKRQAKDPKQAADPAHDAPAPSN